MCKYFDFFVLFATVNLTDLIGGGGRVGERIDFAQAGEEVRGRIQEGHPASPLLVLTEILNLWRVRRK